MVGCGDDGGRGRARPVRRRRARGATPVVLTGTCVQWSGGYSRASCDQAHAGKIVGTATNPDGCAARSSFFRYDSRVYCIDTSQ
jgi:hypothetical protein